MLKQLKIALPVIAAAMLCGAPFVQAAPADQMKPMSNGMTQPQKVDAKKAKASDMKKAAKSEVKKPEVKKSDAKKVSKAKTKKSELSESAKNFKSQKDQMPDAKKPMAR